MTINKSEFAKFVLQSNVEAGAEAIANVLRTLESATTEIKRFSDSYHFASQEGSNVTPEDILSWVTNYVASSILGNCRLDMLVTHAARIAAARVKVSE